MSPLANVIAAVTNPDICETWQLIRNTGSWKAGGWSEDTSTTMNVYGVASVADDRALDMLPEGDRVRGGMMFWSMTEMFVTNEGAMGTSDVLVWRGEQYRILSVRQYPQRGYFRAMTVRMRGN